MNVLITNIRLDGRSGTELYVRDLAMELKRCGHYPVVYTSAIGVVAKEIRAAGILVTNRIADIDCQPDVIHGHHRDETMTALLAFPGVPGIFVCHDMHAWHDQAPLFPRIRRYLAVSDFLRQRLLRDGVPEDRTQVLHNFVDMERFHTRPLLPEYPRRALVFSNAASKKTYLPGVVEACERRGIAVEAAGLAVGRTLDRPEEVLGQFDLVFAKGKAALESLAVGTAVIVCDATGVGPMVTSAEFARIRDLNFGLRLMTEPHSAEVIGRCIERYDAEDATNVRNLVRCEAGLKTAAGKLVSIYQELIAEHRAADPQDFDTERIATKLYLENRIAVARQPLSVQVKSTVGKIPLVGPSLRWLRQRYRRLL